MRIPLNKSLFILYPNRCDFFFTFLIGETVTEFFKDLPGTPGATNGGERSPQRFAGWVQLCINGEFTQTLAKKHEYHRKRQDMRIV